MRAAALAVARRVRKAERAGKALVAASAAAQEPRRQVARRVARVTATAEVLTMGLEWAMRRSGRLEPVSPAGAADYYNSEDSDSSSDCDGDDETDYSDEDVSQ